MKLKFLATGQSPDYYEFNGDVITAYLDGDSETYDLSGFPEGGKFTSADPINGVPAIRDVARVDGVLRATLCQQVGPGHWQESEYTDVGDYDPDAVHVVLDPHRPYGGRAWAKTRNGKTYMTEESHHE